MSYFEAPYPPYDPTDPTSFSYETVVKRWPIILTSVIDEIYRTDHDLSLRGDAEEQINEGKWIIEQISRVKYEMGRDKPLSPIEDDGEADIETYKLELQTLGENNTWFTAPWLYAECYLYRLIRSWFASTIHWRTHDPFQSQKVSAFKSSSTAVFKLATMIYELDSEKSVQKENGRDMMADTERLRVLFQEMIQMCLWGNATDLSLLTNITHADIQKLQTVGKNAQAERRQYILRDDSNAVWEHLSGLRDARIDFVLDNAGFEVFTDLILADFLVTFTPYVSRVVFHPKSIPWFVSDVTPPDFTSVFSALLSPTEFPPLASSELSSPSDRGYLEAMVQRWKAYLASGVFALSVPADAPLGIRDDMVDFWTQPYPYWDMKLRAPTLFKSLQESGLVIFKGDLNYRKLTGDIRWPVDTPFRTAIGPLAGSFPLLSLRTNKADVVVGIDQAIADQLDARGEKWRFNGKYALVSFEPCGIDFGA